MKCDNPCRACHHKDLSYGESLKQKQNWIIAQLNQSKIDFLPEPIQAVTEQNSWSYRRRILLRAFFENDSWQFGMLLSKKPLRWISIPDCPVQNEKINLVLRRLSRLLPQELPLHAIEWNLGLVTLVLKAKPNEQIKAQLLTLNLLNVGAEGIWLNWNPVAGHRATSAKDWEHLAGQKYIWDVSPWGKVRVGPDSFVQQISSLHHESLKSTANFFKESEPQLIVDLYSGNGTSLLLWKKLGFNFCSVEMSGQAVENAKASLPDSVHDDSILLRGRVEQRIPQMSSWLKNRAHFIYANPGREGCGENVMRWICEQSKPARIAYLSCNIKSAIADLSPLINSGYQLVKITPYDFLPHTNHVETLWHLKKD